MIVEPKPVIIKLYTDWCMYCKIQDQQLKRSAAVSAYLTKNFYFLNFNAESRDEVIFNQTVFKYKPKGLHSGINELALLLAGETKELSYPYWVVLDENYNVLTSHRGYLKSKNLMVLLKSVIESKNLSVK
jgi:thioredoxin-related protein